MLTTGACPPVCASPATGGSIGGLARRAARAVGRNWARLGYAYHVEPTWLAVNRVELPVKGLPAALSGLRIAHLSDFHCGNHIPTGYLEGVIERTAQEAPDLIALTGDFIDRGPEHAAGAARLFRSLQAPLGVFAVLGNHDFSVHVPQGKRKHPGLDHVVADALGAEGVTVLRNRSVAVSLGGETLTVAGIDDLWSGESDVSAALGGACEQSLRVLLAHNPESAAHLGSHRADLVLSGHTHGGQINWPGLGRLFLHRSARRWAAGLYPVPHGHLYVNTGVGFGWRFRFGVRPELAILTLRSA
ncbi:metallophosphoesterase [Gemmata sp. JC717]|uniref:metallophosphoesterase n=1 Tax=Gemmata algarum TaxID=2975278 RepID=UPI0021BB30BD|nr:metallophosphoesterase [Gemmata algarum]MDY3553152.1 metallophosphoesterase [Gemmata algarum]